MKVFDLAFNTDHYYIKRPSIVEQIQFDNRTFYAKFERVDEPLSDLVIKQHMDKQYTIAVPLLKDGVTDYLVLDYKGDEYQRFIPLVKHLFSTMKISNYYIYQGRDEERVRVFIEVDHLSLKDADVKLKEISDNLSQKLSKKWKCLPLLSLPEAYNIVTLPYKEL